MKKEDEPAREGDDLRPEYDFAELKGKVRGKYLERYRRGTNLALLAPDVRTAFPTDESVNLALRSLAELASRPRTDEELGEQFRSLCDGIAWRKRNPPPTSAT
jgi:hypothetical protein